MHGCPWPHALLLLLALPLQHVAEQPWPLCDTWSANYSAGSTYEANLITLLGTLRQNASSSASLFASGALGATPDTVYGLMLCRGDVSASDCFNCGTYAGQDARKACSFRSRDVALCYDQCYVLLSHKNFLASTDNSGEIRGAADLSPVHCRSCLNGLIEKWSWSTAGSLGDGARIAGARCTLRFEVGFPFYAGGAMVVLWPDKGSDGTSSSLEPLLWFILPILWVALIAAIVWTSICRILRRSRRAPVSIQSHSVDDPEGVNSGFLSLSSLQKATENFDDSNKLGQGGFGIVYKGVLSGREVAVKRLSKTSNQGLEEVKNELVLVAKLNHRNLVRLVGFSLEAGERLLVYEYMPNKSLDTILFDPEEKHRLNWAIRYKIIEGVAQGLQYLHEESPTRIVHCDLKASNLLLDADMIPKIADFGLARLFGEDQTREVTSRIIGTFGYMSPEYVMCGQYSIKSDVYSFGVLVIEIVMGRMRNNSSIGSEENEDIMSIVWKHWAQGTVAETVDYSLGSNYPEAEVLKCVHIGLLCVQQNPIDRPTMTDIMVMLNKDTTTSSLPAVARPEHLLDGSSYFDSRSYTDSLNSGR